MRSVFLDPRFSTPPTVLALLLAGVAVVGCGGSADGFADRTSTVTTFVSPRSAAAGGRAAISFTQDYYGDSIDSWGKELGFVPKDGKWTAAVRPSDGVWRVSFAAQATHPQRPVHAVWEVDLPFGRAMTSAEMRTFIAAHDGSPTPRTPDARLLGDPVTTAPLPGRNVRLVVRLRSISADGRSMLATIAPVSDLPKWGREVVSGDSPLTRGLALLKGEHPRSPIRLRVLDGAQLAGQRGTLSAPAFRRTVRREAPVLAYVRSPDVADAIRWLKGAPTLPVDQVVLTRR